MEEKKYVVIDDAYDDLTIEEVKGKDEKEAIENHLKEFYDDEEKKDKELYTEQIIGKILSVVPADVWNKGVKTANDYYDSKTKEINK